VEYKIFIKKSAEKEMDILPDKISERILRIILSLKNEPKPHGIIKLKNIIGYRIRVGEYRILYSVDEKEKKIEISSVLHRKDAYK